MFLEYSRSKHQKKYIKRRKLESMHIFSLASLVLTVLALSRRRGTAALPATTKRQSFNEYFPHPKSSKMNMPRKVRRSRRLSPKKEFNQSRQTRSPLALPFTPQKTGFRPKRYRSNKYMNKSVSPRADISAPDVQVILQVILDAQTALDNDINLIVEDVKQAIITKVNTAAADESGIIQPIITAGNATLSDGIQTIIDGASGVIDAIVQEISTQEHTDSSVVLQQKNTTLVQNIQTLINTLQSDVDTLLTAHGVSELDAVKNLITEENDALYAQIETILNDPNNNNPIIPQLIFPDPVTISESIEPGKIELTNQISNLMNTFITDVQALLTATGTSEKDQVTIIMNDGTTELITRLEDLASVLLPDVQQLVDDVTAQEITDIQAGIGPIQSQLETDITTEVNRLSTETADAITSVTATELATITPVIAQYNQDIAAGLLNNLLIV